MMVKSTCELQNNFEFIGVRSLVSLVKGDFGLLKSFEKFRNGRNYLSVSSDCLYEKIINGQIISQVTFECVALHKV